MSGKISGSESENTASAPTSNYTAATDKYLSGIDARADALREAILNSKTEISVKGTAYYISTGGNDSSDGKSPENAWATLLKASNANLVAGDAVFFERGGVFRGSLYAKEGVTYSAYGKGDKPEIIGSPQNYSVKDKWKETGTPNVYVYNQEIKYDAGILVFNDGEAYTYKKVTGIDNFGGNPNELKSDLEMYHSTDDKKVYLYSDKGNPADRFSSVEFCLKVHIIRIDGDNVTIDNLCVKYGGAHGVSAVRQNNLTVTNCEFGWIGGSLQYSDPAELAWVRSLPQYRDPDVTTRYGNAVELAGGFNGYKVHNCYIYQVYDAGITHQATSGNDIIIKNVTYTNNLIEYCTYSIEYFLGAPAAGTSPERIMSDIIMRDNICRFAGYGWGDQRPNKKEAAHIKSWDHMNTAENFVMENNIFDRSRYMLLHIGVADASSLPLMKNNTYIQIENDEFGRYGVNPTKVITFNRSLGYFFKNGIREQNSEVKYILLNTNDINGSKGY